ncbi:MULTISPECIES: ABC transporter permease [Pseudomonadota]|uniref:ABC transporter permease n=1 Tax=Pseudomonadota TaxID=1224 RepID=UPI000847B397|nr:MULTISPECIES: ABC transporter permease [Pseudomonadota]MDA8259660.1 ABC transporter permease [Betaproteobacteria bacterium]TNY01590.1 ABC transporter permease [Stenotrophomonas maltophilia]MCA8495698.1 ABC transporter permease [Burkholderia arboris]RUE38639.1 ABC transporter permease [Pseudomonas aeruginosa]TPD80319.1 ABC transporter permease [Stenotrophomonas maltophilia]
MNLGKLVWRNLLRRRGRFIFTLAGVSVGMAAFVALMTIGQGLTGEIRKQAQGLGANLVVTPKGWCAYEQISVLTGEQLPEAIPMSELEKIRTVPGVGSAVPYLNEKTAFRNQPVPVIGIWPEPMRTLQKWTVESGRYFNAPDERGVVIGAAIAKQFQLKPGDEFTVRGKPLPVIGVLREAGTKDDIATFIPLPLGQQIYEVEDKVSFIAVQVTDLEQLEAVSLNIQEVANVAVVSDKQLLASILSIVGTVSAAMQAVAAVGVLAAAFGIVNTLLTAVYERRREIGILQALGSPRRTLFLAFMLESGLYGLLGGLLGTALGLLGAWLFGPALTDNAFTASLRQSPTPVLDEATLLFTLTLSVGLALLAGLYPAYRAAQLSPVEAMRHV